MYNETPKGYAEELLDGITDTIHEGYLFDEMALSDHDIIKKIAIMNIDSILQTISPSTFLPDKWSFYQKVAQEIELL